MSRRKEVPKERILGKILQHCKSITKSAQCIRHLCKEDLKEENEIFAFFDGFMAYIDELLSFIINAIEKESYCGYSLFFLHAGEILQDILVNFDLMTKGEAKNEQAENS